MTHTQRRSETRDPHIELKKAILAMNMSDTDVALRAIARIDNSPEFRLAFEAAVATGSPQALVNLINAQIPKLDKNNEYTHAFNEARETNPFKEMAQLDLEEPANAKQLMQLLNLRATHAAANLLSEYKIDRYVTSFVERHVEALIKWVMGFKTLDSWGRIEMREGAPTLFVEALRKKIAEVTPQIVDNAIKTINFHEATALTSEQVQTARYAYKEAYDRAIRERLQKWAADKAKIDCERLFAEALEPVPEPVPEAVPISEEH